MFSITTCQPRPKATYSIDPKFGTVFAPHMLRMQLHTGNGHGYKAEIVPMEPEAFSPATVVFHYGQSVFEGMKAFLQNDGTVAVFRADLHAERFQQSALRMAMPAIPNEIFLESLKRYVAFEKQSVPGEVDHALYLRPLLIARDEVVKVGKAKNYTFYILGCIVGNYFPGGAVRAAKVLVNRYFVRACPGGLGEAKTAANYAASLLPQAHAEKLGYDQVLYLDALKHESIDELGGMNFFVVRDGEIITPKLNGCILNGVTRRSILTIASQLKLKASEQQLSFQQVKQEIQSGKITEAFACGTAAVVQPIGEIGFQESADAPVEKVLLPPQHPVSLKLLQRLKEIQRGEGNVPSGWLFRC